MDDHWVWDGSLIEGDDGEWHLFASRWPKRLPMHPSWLLESEIVRATAPTATGPFTFREVVLPERDPVFFDARMTHNPSIRRVGDTYLLFYIGVTYGVDAPDDPTRYPSEDVHRTDPWLREVWLRKRIGLATSDSLAGPWRRMDEPLLLPRADRWDNGTSSNPSPWVEPDGSIYLAYKSANVSSGTRLRPFRIGLARAEAWDRPFERVLDHPVLPPTGTEGSVEDPYLFREGDGLWHLLVKDLSGVASGHKGHGLHATSEDAIHWHWDEPMHAYGLDVRWRHGDGGGVRHETLTHIERPQLVFDREGRATHFTAACARGGGDLQGLTDTWVGVWPLSSE
ncbi:MAG: glycoside hydrolase family protein [Planctomycetota bacterium]